MIRWRCSGSAAVAAIATGALVGWVFHLGCGLELGAQVVNPPDDVLAIESIEDFMVFANVLDDADTMRRVDRELERTGACTGLTFDRRGWSPPQPPSYSVRFEFGERWPARVIVGYTRDPVTSPPAAPPDAVTATTVTLPSRLRASTGGVVFADAIERTFLSFVLREAQFELTAPLQNLDVLRRVGVESIGAVPGRGRLLVWFEYWNAQGGVSTITVIGEHHGPSTFLVTSIR